MSPPIRDGSGSSIGSIRLGDGTEISEVRTGAGDVLFSAIPDSVLIQQFATTYAGGDAKWVDDATDDGSQDAAIVGDPTKTTLSDGSEAVSFDGGGDRADLTLPSELEGSGLQSFTVEFAAQWTTTQNRTIATVRNDNGNQIFGVELNINENRNQDVGDVLFTLRDNDLNQLQAAPQTNPNLDDGNRHDLTFIVNDSATNDVEIIIDGSSVSLAFGNTESPDNFVAWDRPIPYAAKNLGGTISTETDIEIGAARWHDESINSQTISDYS
jgi:hypothetical protein